MNYRIVYKNNNELMHYGVLGMKWGVRTNPIKANYKSGKKLNKLKTKADKYRAKTKIYYEKSGKGYITDIGKARRDKYLRKSRRAAYKAGKYDRKAAKWQKTMDKVITNDVLRGEKTFVEPKNIREAVGKLHAKNLTRLRNKELSAKTDRQLEKAERRFDIYSAKMDINKYDPWYNSKTGEWQIDLIEPTIKSKRKTKRKG